MSKFLQNFSKTSFDIFIRGGQKKIELNQSICWPSGRRREVTRPKEREDGWMEAELGELYNESCCDDISVSVVETKSPYWKRGLIIQGIEFHPH